MTRAASDRPEPESAQRAKKDTLPFHKDSPLVKMVVLIAIFGPIVGTVWAIVNLWGHGISGLDLGLLLGGWAFTGIGITLGYHRLIAHKTFTAVAPVRFVLYAAGAMALQGSPSDWGATHVKHHAKADQEGDPHSPAEGFLHAHLGWLLRDRFVRSGPVWESIRQDPMVRLVDKTWGFWALLSIFAPFGIGLAVTGTLVGAWQAFLWGSGVRILMGHHITWCVNSFGHVVGTRPHDTADRSRNNALLALVSWGEGWHNNHHAAPGSAFIGRRWYQVDIGAYVLRLLTMFRLAAVNTKKAASARTKQAAASTKQAAIDTRNKIVDATEPTPRHTSKRAIKAQRKAMGRRE